MRRVLVIVLAAGAGCGDPTEPNASCAAPLVSLGIGADESGSGAIRVDQAALMREVGQGRVVAAGLRLRVVSGTGEGVVAYRLRRYESDPADTATATTTLGRENQVEIDVTRDVADFLNGTAPNYGWILRPEGGAPASQLDAPTLALCVEPATAPADFIGVAPDRWNFRRSASGRFFVPAGVNYDHDATASCPRLLEEYWDDWDTVEGDLAEMKALGFNVIRVHLQYEAFMLAVDRPNEARLIKLDQLVRAAQRHGLYLNLTGLAHYRREQIPAWFVALDDEAAMTAEAAFWAAVAARYPGEPAIFCYDLQNEPFVSAGDTEEVVSGPFSPCDPDGDGPEPARGFSFVNFHFRHAGARWTAWVQAKYGTEAALDAAWPDYPRAGESWTAIGRPILFSSPARVRDSIAFAHAMAALWTARMAAAVRAVDSNHLVTVGLTSGSLPFQDRLAADAGQWLIYSSFSPYHVASSLDFVSVHVYLDAYGDTSNVDLSEMILRGAHVGMPVVLEETFPFVGGGDFERFLGRSLGSVSGWFSFYWGKTPDELRALGTLPAAVVAGWIERYSHFVSHEVPAGGVTRAAAAVVAPVSIADQLLSQEARVGLVDQYSAVAATGGFLDPVLGP